MYVFLPSFLHPNPLPLASSHAHIDSFSFAATAASHFFSPKDLEDFEKESRKMPNSKAVALKGTT